MIGHSVKSSVCVGTIGLAESPSLSTFTYFLANYPQTLCNHLLCHSPPVKTCPHRDQLSAPME